MTYRGAVLLHGMGHLVVLVSSAPPRKEAVLTHVEVEALETPVPGQHHQDRIGTFRPVLLHSVPEHFLLQTFTTTAIFVKCI